MKLNKASIFGLVLLGVILSTNARPPNVPETDIDSELNNQITSDDQKKPQIILVLFEPRNLQRSSAEDDTKEPGDNKIVSGTTSPSKKTSDGSLKISTAMTPKMDKVIDDGSDLTNVEVTPEQVKGTKGLKRVKRNKTRIRYRNKDMQRDY